MYDPKKLRYSGLAALLGGVLWIMQGLYVEAFPTHLLFAAPLMMAVGFTGFYLSNRGVLKGLGQSGFTQGVVGLLLLAAGFLGAYALDNADLLRVASFGFLITAFGLVLTGYACIKEGLMPGLNWLPLALGAVAPLGLLGGEVELLRTALAVAFGLGWALFGVLILIEYGRREDLSSG